MFINAYHITMWNNCIFNKTGVKARNLQGKQRIERGKGNKNEKYYTYINKVKKTSRVKRGCRVIGSFSPSLLDCARLGFIYVSLWNVEHQNVYMRGNTLYDL
uniref:Transposase n=1 Tax=Heterorhabditis bacteriophora TaxID=37862 RepID=A0A1I7W867_HETBA